MPLLFYLCYIFDYKEDHMSGAGKKVLRNGIVAMLFAGGWISGGINAGAVTVDMTSSENLDGIHVSATSKIENNYIYKWDNVSQSIIGGTIAVDTTSDYFTAHLQIQASDLPDLSASTVKKVAKQLVEKMTNHLETSRYMVYPCVEILDGDKLLRRYAVEFDDDWVYKESHNAAGRLGNLSEGSFSSAVINTGNPAVTEYDFNEDGIFLNRGAAFKINVEIKEASADNKYAVIRSTEAKNVGISNVDGNSSYSFADNKEVIGIIDSSSYLGSEAYGVLNNTDSIITIREPQATFRVVGSTSSTGIYAASELADTVSTVKLDGRLSFDLKGHSTIGIEAGKNGKIITFEDIRNKGSNLTVSSPNGYAAYAHDGGIIELNSLNVMASGKDTIYAEKGGSIILGDLSGTIKSIKTDSDKKSKIKLTSTGTLETDLEGNVDAVIKGKWKGDHKSSGSISIAGGNWEGAVTSDNTVITVDNNGMWSPNNISDIHLGGFIGSASSVNRGYMNMGKYNVDIAKYAGNGTFVYQHDSSEPTKLIGGNIKIIAAEPLSIYSEGIGFGDEAHTVMSKVDSTITLATSVDGIDITNANQINAVLQSLADKLIYSNYAAGERNLTGTVEIQEGLTSSSIARFMARLSFDEETGQAYLGKVIKPYSDIITGYIDDDKAYKDIYDANTKTYNFNNDGYILVKKTDLGDKSTYLGAVTNYGHEWETPSQGWGTFKSADPHNGPSYTIDMHGHDLDIDLEAYPVHSGGGYPMWTSAAVFATREGTITIDNPGKISITTNANYYYGSNIRASTSEKTETGAHVVINNDNKPEHAVVIRGGIPTAGFEMNFRSIETYGYRGSKDTPEDRYKLDNSVTIKGLVDIKTNKNTALFARGGNISIGGGIITAQNYDSMWTVGKGRIDLNMITDEDGHIQDAGTNPLVINGNAATVTTWYGSGGTINMGLATDKSVFNGQTYGDGEQNIWLKNGAVWNNKPEIYKEWNATQTTVVDRESTATNLHGGDSLKNAGIIHHTGEKKLTVENLDGYVNIYMDPVDENLKEAKVSGGPLDINLYKGHTIVIYKHEIKDDRERENAALYGNKVANIIGGDLTVTKAAEKSSITLRTDNDGLNPGSGVYTDRNLVSDTLDKLANKLYYTAYKEGERNLTGIVEIAEGLTSSAVSRKTGGVAYKEDGQGEYTYKLVEKPADSQSVTEYGKAILGSNDRDTMYIDTGVLKDGVYHFTKSETTIAIDGTVDKAEGKRDLVEFGPWFRYLDAAISGSVPQYDEEGNKITYDPTTVVSNSVKMDLHGNKLNINAKYDQGAGQTGIAAIAAMNRVETAGKVEINNAGAMNVNVKGSGMTAALFADGGGKLVIHNGGENQEEKILTLRGGSLYKNSGVGIKTMNGNIKAESGVNKHSEITIDGLVDVVADGKASADGYSSNEAVSAVASDINIGGGTIKAVNGAWAAIRAYGEFTTPNYGIVNVNAANRTYVNEDGTAMGGTVKVHKVSDFDIGENRAVIEGDIVTNGGMGTKGQVNIGLKDKDSHWIGNYADTVGYGVTQGSFGAVNIKMKDGAFWKGFGNGSMNIEMTGKRTYWHGFSIVEKMQLSLKDGSTWYNAITPEQTNQSGKAAHAKIGWLTSDNGVIDMVGRNVFVATSTSLNGQTTAENPSGIVESENGVTGNVEIKNYSGNTAVIYKHEIKDDEERENAALYGNKAANIIGGTLTVAKAAANSFITLRTDNEGLNTSSDKAADKNLVSETLNKLANKLFYTAYKDGERNLTGKVEIAEGLTASAAGLRIGDITYKDADGQGYYAYTPAIPESQTIREYTEGITGYEEEDIMYVNTGVLKNGIYTFGLTPTTITAEKPIAAETDITIQGGSIKMELKNSGENKTALETGANTVTVTAGRLDMKEGDADIKGGTLNAYTDIKGREIKVENGGKLHMAGNLDIDTLSVNGENAKALLLADKEGTPSITAKVKNITVKDKALLNASKGAKTETEGTISVNNAAANFNDTVTMGKGLKAENGARIMVRNGGEIRGAVTVKGEKTLASLSAMTIKKGSVIEASGKGQIDINGGNTEENRIKADGGTVKLRQGTFRIGDIEATNKGTAYIEGENGTTITGTLKSEGAGSTVTGVLKGNKSILKGNLEGNGKINLYLEDKAEWKGTGNVTGKLKITLREGSLWTNTGKSDIGWLTSKNGNIDMRESREGYVRITNYSGTANILYGQDGKGNIKGGDITIRTAETGSRVNLITDNSGLNTSQTAGTEEKALVIKTLDNMARKLNYIGYQKGERNLEGSVTIAEGLTAPSAVLKTGAISYSERGNGRYIEKGEKKETGKKTLGNLGMTREALHTPETAGTGTAANTGTNTTAPRMMKAATAGERTSSVIYGDKETQMMKGSKTAMTAATLLWRGNNNDLARRMGDIRLGREESGIWARYLGGKNKLDKQNTCFKQTYDIAQAGYDKKRGNWTIGAALDYGTGKDTYASGTGKEKLASLSLYGTMQKEDGQYMDIILKGSRVKNDYTVYNEMGHRLEGKYRTSGLSLSVEYGKRIEKENGFYIDPSIEVTAGHLGGKDYDAVSDYAGGKKMHIRQDGINSVIGRIGLGIGKETERSNLFAKIALAHEFGGKVKSTFSAENEPTSGTEIDLKDSWVDVEIGGSRQINRNTYLYGTYTRNFGADLTNKWRIDAGIRFSF